MANITTCVKNGIEYYRITTTIGYVTNKNGKVVQKKKEFLGKTKKEVEQKYKDYLKKDSLNLDNSKQYFGLLADRWIYNFLIQDSTLQDSTIGLYVGTWNKYVKPSELYHMSLEKISAGRIQVFYNDLFKRGCPSSAIKSINKMMSRFYKYLVQNGFAPFDFTNTLSIPKEKKEGEKEIRIWTDEEISKIMKGFGSAQNGFRLRFLIVLAFYTGMRISELLGLKYEDIKKTANGYTISVCRQVRVVPHYSTNGTMIQELEATTLKSQSSYRTIPLNASAISEFKNHKKWHLEEQLRNGYRTDYVFTTDSGGLIDRRNAEHSCKRYYKRIGVEPKGFHTYRHTFGTNLYKKGVPMKTASDLLGHSDISVTAKYYINTPEEEKIKAIEMLSAIV